MKTVKLVALSVGLAFACLVEARTIALWPLNWRDADNTINGTCVVNGNNSLSTDAALEKFKGSPEDMEGHTWRLPSNRDLTVDLSSEPVNESAGFSRGTEGATHYLYSRTVGEYLTSEKDFTVEGWFRFPELPANGGLFFFVDADGTNTSGNQRWFLTLRNNNTHDGVTWQLFSSAHGTGDALLHRLSTSEVEDLTRGWHHFALSHEACTVDGKSVWRFYQDGALWGTITTDAVLSPINTTGFFAFGGRNNPGNVFKGAVSYCRLSDRVLQPFEFLNSDSGTAGFTPRGFWRLNRESNGDVNGAPSEGNAHLSCGFLAAQFSSSSSIFCSDSVFAPDSDSAFTGNYPPNRTVFLPNGNQGSLLGDVYDLRTSFRVDGLGYHLSLTNDFTVEGWMKLQMRSADWKQTILENNGYRHLIGTRWNASDPKGWIFQVTQLRDSTVLQVHVQDEHGTFFATPPTLADITAYDGQWIHVALVYECTGGSLGFGRWSCYVNGVLTGFCEHDVAPVDGAVLEGGLVKFSSITARGPSMAFPGKLDCWRVSRAALRPTQLLCASENSEAVPDADVVALWPMNSQRGVVVDLVDEMGSYTFQRPYASKYLVTGCEDAPDVPGISSPTNGSAGFRVKGDGANSYLVCNYGSALDAFTSSFGWTFETYVKRTEATINGKNEFVYLRANNNASTGLGQIGILVENFNYGKTATGEEKGFCLYVSGLTWEAGTTLFGTDAQFLGEDGQPVVLPLDAWTHLALTRTEEEGRHVFRLYLNGELRGTLAATGTLPSAQMFYLGGRPQSDTSFRGQFSCVRISEGACPVEKMLCAPVEEPRTVAFWPLDFASDALDLTGRVPWEDNVWGLTAVGACRGLDAGARNVVPRPDPSEGFVGTPGRNRGAVTLGGANAALAVSGAVGPRMDLRRPFTVEGWIRWAHAQGAAQEVVAGTYNPADTYQVGWKLVLDSTGERPVLRLKAKLAWPQSVIAEGILLADAACLDEWRHLALRYDPSTGNGIWSLLLDGVETGLVVENLWMPKSDLEMGSFWLGAYAGGVSFMGDYDMWRVSSQVLGAEEILWKRPVSLSIFIR